MTSQQFTTLLNDQLSSGYIDVSQLGDVSYVQVFNKLGINTRLGIQSLSSNEWRVDDGGETETISLDAQLTQDSSVLAIGASSTVHFIFTSLPDTDNLYSLCLTIDLPTDWTFSKSFPLLAGPTFDSITLDSTSGNTPILRIEASVQVISAPETYPELWFSGNLNPTSSVFVVLAELFSGNHHSPLAEGRIDFDASTGLALMNIPFATSSITGVFGESGPDFNFSINIFGGVNPDINLYQPGILFVTDILLGTVTVPLTALYNDTSGNCLDLQIDTISVNWVSAVDSLLVYFGSNHQLSEYIPENFPFEELTITGIGFEISLLNLELNSSWLGIAVLENTSWDVWPGKLSLSSIKFSFSVQDPLTPSETTYNAELSALAVFGGENGLPLLVSGILPDLKLSGSLGQESYDLIPFMESVFGSSKGLPDDLEITKLDFGCDISGNYYEFDLEITGFWEIEFGQDSVLEFEELKIAASYDRITGAQGTLYAKFIINDSVFNTELDLSAQNVRLAGEWQADGDTLDYSDIAIAFGMYGLPDLPENLQLDLSEASFELETAGPSASFTLTSANYGSAALIAGKDGNGNWGFVFGMLTGLDAQLNLTDIDVVGNFVPSGMDTISVNNLRFVGATQALPLYTPTPELDNILGSEINSGLVLSVDLAIGSLFSETFTVRFGGLDDGSANDTPPPPIELPEGLGEDDENAVVSTQLDTTTTSTAAVPGPTSTWIDIQRAFGPVHINRIGFRITEDNSLGILLDADIKLAGLTIGLDALEADLPIQSPFWPSFSLGGLEVGYSAPGFMLAGGLQKLYGSDPAQYTGELIVQAGSFGASAFGSYTTVNGDPSLFAFLALNVPIGGPPFCVVTGLSLGFGYNRRLILPDINNVQTYPLVQAAMGITDPQATINALNQYIVPAENQYWLAAGIRFTSFEMLNAYALLTASFGTQVELALMGEAMLTLPVAVPGETATVLAQADMVLLAAITPSLGQIAISAQLTSRSFILDRNAQITGGFAFYFWYGKSAHKGDFVVTLGGYNPLFNKPDYYPSVPLLGLNWKISDLISIKGGLYCALTPSVIMAGGNLSATYQSGDVKAWFTANADFLMRFKPFAFDVTMAVSVGASYKLNLLFTSKTVTVTVGANLHLWGPPFAGSAVVDLKVMSFTINFGAARVQAPTAISWNEFRNSFLPPEPLSQQNSLLSLDQQNAGGATQSLITYSSEDGLLGSSPAEMLGSYGASLPAGSTVWKIDPGHASILINFSIPLTEYWYTTENSAGGTQGVASVMGVGPMGIGAGGLTTKADVQITYSNGISTNEWQIETITDNVPSGLWLNTTNSMTSPALVMNQITGLRFWVHVSDEPYIRNFVTVSLDVLLFYKEPDSLVGNWSTAIADDADSFDQYNAISVVQNSLTNSSVVAFRSAVLDLLNEQGLTVYTGDEIETDRYVQQLPELVYSAPQIRFTGEAA